MDTDQQYQQQLNLGFANLYKNTRRPVAVDLFAGAGGFSLGMEQAGFDVLVAVEYDPVHACTYAYNFPHTEVICASVTDVDATDIYRAGMRSWEKHRLIGCGFPSASMSNGLSNTSVCGWNQRVDLVFGGPPCQGFSIAGKRIFDDERNSLIFHFLRLVCALRPRFFVMENVPGIAAGKYKELLKELEERFIAAGYWTKATCLNAVDFGVPQRRKRLFLIGGIYAEDAKLLFHHLQPVSFRTTVKDAIADLPDIDRYSELLKADECLLSQQYLEAASHTRSAYIRFLQGDLLFKTVTNHSPDCHQNLIAEKEIEKKPKTEKAEFNITDLSYPRLWNPRLLTSSMQTQHRETSKQRYSQLLPGELEPISRLRRLDWYGVSHTLRAGTDSSRGRHTSPRPIHPIFARVITVREAARLHSFPDWFRFHHTKWHGFRQVGNSVPPLLARGIGEAIAKTMDLAIEAPGVFYSSNVNLENITQADTKTSNQQFYSFQSHSFQLHSFRSQNFQSQNPQPQSFLVELGNPQILKFNPSEARTFWRDK